MPRKKHKYHFIYKTTCLLNENYYIGMHSTSNLNDGYLGSGKRLNYSVRKHGVENFKREILEFCDSRESLKKKETEIVNDDLLDDPRCMNIQHGGGGGFIDKEHQKKCSEAGSKALSIKFKTDEDFIRNQKERSGKILIECMNDGRIKRCDWNGRHHREEVKTQIGLTNSTKQLGVKNSQYGTCWITNEKENKKIHRGDSIPDGWKLGRK